MQLLVIYFKSNRKLIAAMELQTIITEMNVIVIPGVTYLVTSKKDIFHTASDGTVYVKEI